MQEKKIENKLKTAVSHIVPDVLDEVLSKCDIPSNKNIESILPLKKRKNPFIYAASAAAILVFILCSAIGIQKYQIYYVVDSIVELDVNPGIELKINEVEKVLSINTVNEDAVIILDNMNLKGTDLKVAVNALIGSMLKNGYLDELANSILITVENQDTAKGAQLQQKLVEEINQIFSSYSMDGAILSQALTKDEQLHQLAKTYQITIGKAALIQQLVTQNSLLYFEELANIPINELNLMLTSQQTLLENIKSDGIPSDKAYIGEERAKEIAFSHLGVTESKVSRLEIKFDIEHGYPKYELEFQLGKNEYEYDINAVTGELISYNFEIEENSIQKDDKTKTENKTQINTEEIDNEEKEIESKQKEINREEKEINNEVKSYIGEKRAKEIALSHAGILENTVRKLEIESDYEDGILIYEIEFKVNGMEYKYEIDGSTGVIIKSEIEED